VRSDNRGAIAFYTRIGFMEDASVSLGKRLESDEA
jgi:ribosomal protein S18 acetylase RimI-like enzyme